MITRVIVNGSQGKMGLLACQTLDAHPQFELIGRLSRQDDLASMIKQSKAEIVVDLTRSDVVYENTLTIIENGAHPVIGTSGLLDSQIQCLKDRCQVLKLGGIIIPNFSISAVLMMRFAAEAARFIDNVEIIEMHHPQKFDAPSGTAMKTAEMIAAERKKTLPLHPSQEIIAGARGALYEEIPIHSLRLPGVVARQEVIFGSIGETLSISHESIDRVAFMPGLVLACQRVASLPGLYYGLEHLLWPS